MANSRVDPAQTIERAGNIGSPILDAKPASYNQTFYDRIAREYDRSYHPASKYRDLCTSIETQFIISNMLPNGRTLEVGPGQGRFTQNLAASSEIVVAADVSSNMLQICRARTTAVNVVYNHMGIFELDDQRLGGRFDTIVAMWIIPHLEDGTAAVKKLASLLKPGGRLVFNLWNLRSIEAQRVRMMNRTASKAVSSIEEQQRVYTRYYSYAEMLELIGRAELTVVQERGWCLVPIMNYRGGRLLFPLYRVLDTSLQTPFKKYYYSRLFAVCHTTSTPRHQG